MGALNEQIRLYERKLYHHQEGGKTGMDDPWPQRTAAYSLNSQIALDLIEKAMANFISLEAYKSTLPLLQEFMRGDRLKIARKGRWARGGPHLVFK